MPSARCGKTKGVLRLPALGATVALAALSASTMAVGSSGQVPRHAARCALFASQRGSDAAGNGSIGRPFASLQRLDRALRPGQTGCLRAGGYGSTSTWHKIYTSGAPSHQITITSYPGELATIVGYVDIEASYTTVTRVRIDGSNTFYRTQRARTTCPYPVSQPLVIGGRGDVLDHIDYYQSVPHLRGNGIGIGFWGHADNTIIRYSKIHDVGQCMAYDQLIYVAGGTNVQIYGNWLWNDPHGRGIQLYPGPTSAKVFDNVIDHAGEGFVVGNEAGYKVSGNQIFHNVISNCTGLPWEGIPGQAVHALYAGAAGSGNSFHDNITYRDPGGIGPLSGLIAYRNFAANVHYIDASRHNFATRSNARLRRRVGSATPPGP